MICFDKLNSYSIICRKFSALKERHIIAQGETLGIENIRQSRRTEMHFRKLLISLRRKEKMFSKEYIKTSATARIPSYG